MIIQEEIMINNEKFIHTYSSLLKYIKQEDTGALYNEAYDTVRIHHIYSETDIDLSKEDMISKDTDLKENNQQTIENI